MFGPSLGQGGFHSSGDLLAVAIVPTRLTSIIRPVFTRAGAPGSIEFPNTGGTHTMAEATPNQDFPTILGPDATFKGELTYEKGMRIHGKLEGKAITPGRLHIANAQLARVQPTIPPHSAGRAQYRFRRRTEGRRLLVL